MENITEETELSIHQELITSKSSICTNRITHASSCIKLHHLNKNFYPVFTHQLFENETIQGYEPFYETGYNNDDNRSGDSCCSSSLRSNRNNNYLSIDIYLSPSCRNCQVDFHVWKQDKVLLQKKNTKAKSKTASVLERINTRSSSKRNEKISNGTTTTSDGDDSSYNIESCNSSTESNITSPGTANQEDDGDVTIVAPQDSATLNLKSTRNQITLFEISDVLNKALPHRIRTNGLPKINDKKPQDQVITRKSKRSVQDNLEDDYLEIPLGAILYEYTRNNNEFILSLADGKDKDVLNYHNEVQNISLWFIETADAVDVSDTSEGQWKILYLFQKHTVLTTTETKRRKACGSPKKKKSHKYSFVGYMTLFYFHAPFKKPKSGYVLRICQIFILPSYQRQGHGKEMMLTLYNYMHEQKNIVELTVEDPAPSCTALRDLIDFELFKYCYESTTNYKKKSSTPKLSSIFTSFPLSSSFINKKTTAMSFKKDKTDFGILPEKEVIENASILKITPRQFHRIYELYKLLQLHSIYSNSNEKLRADAMKQYRLFVKKRLNKLYSEELDEWKDDVKIRKEKLGLMFDEIFKYYCFICKVSFE